jgi:hypothetical protein
MNKRNVEIRTLDNDPNTKLQSVHGWKNGAPHITIYEPRIKIANKQHLVVDDAPIRGANNQEFYYISEGTNVGKFVKKEDVKFLEN